MLQTNRKKIRGWKRRKKQINIWFNANKVPDLDKFHSKGEDYVKVRIDPWNRLCERIPPNWYFRLILQKIVIIHNQWKAFYGNQTTPYDLQLWLNFPNTIRSEVVCAKVNAVGERREDSYRRSDIEKGLPKEFVANNDILNHFRWEVFDDEDIQFKKLSYLEEYEVTELLHSGFQEEKVVVRGKEDIMYSRKVGNVWIGRQ
ncbi:hypothetical protein [Dyadobacter diqingensis]|uniref:hypothetical protein n=1 Tax=Dyadobacter diqingensis TaxID=2938121 RepID=UPI0020C1A8E5|nr:hypothetical protein [Dyadobacter diqingensis]